MRLRRSVYRYRPRPNRDQEIIDDFNREALAIEVDLNLTDATRGLVHSIAFMLTLVIIINRFHRLCVRRECLALA